MNELSSQETPLAEALRAVLAALDKSDQPLAARLSRSALRDGLIHPLFLNLRAFWLEQRGRDDEALADLERARELAPDDVPILNALGLALARAHRPVDATRAFEAAIALDPDFAPAHFNHAWVCETWGELDKARRSYERAAELEAGKPNSAESISRLASLAARLGDEQEGRRLAMQALQLMPGHPIALMARARAEIQTGELDAAEATLYRVLTAQSVLTDHRYHAMGVMGDLRHRQKRYADAFRIYTSGNDQYRKTAHARYSSGESGLDAVRWMQRYYEQQSPRSASPLRAAGDPSRCHVHLVGFIRSGTTLLEQALASNPDVVTMEEKEALNDSGPIYLKSAETLDRLHSLNDDERARFVQGYWRSVRGFGYNPDGKVFIDKQPFNTLKLPLIAELFPSAKIIFAIRDPRDVILSCTRRRFSINALTYDLLNLEAAARFYADYMQLAERMMEVLPLQFHRIRHEDVIDNFEGEVRRVCDFIGVEWNDAMVNFEERRKVRSISSPSAAQIAKGLNREGVAQWRHYREQMAPILPILQPWVERFGYPSE
jgi:tetratricopeptide (TPR) repeat protein